MTRTMKQISCFLLIFTMVISMLAIPGLAANTCSSISGSGDCGVKTTFIAKTNRNWTNGSITLKGTRGTYSYTIYGATGAYTKTNSAFGYYLVTAKNLKTGKIEVEKQWKNSSSLKIRLKKNTSYQIQVWAYDVGQTHLSRLFKGGFDKWTSAPTWSAVKTRNVTYCR